MLYNPGALALLTDEEPGFSGGLTLLELNESLYQGRPPGIGTGSTAEQVGYRELRSSKTVGIGKKKPKGVQE